MLLVILLLGLCGTAAELLLLGHYEEWRQMIPLVLLAATLATMAAYGLTRSRRALRGLQVLAILLVVAGGAGLVLHFQGNAEFEREMYPAIGGAKLAWEAARGATPALAPGTMVQLGLLTGLFLYRHPRLRRPRRAGERVGPKRPLIE